MKLLYTAPLWGWLAFAAPPAAAEALGVPAWDAALAAKPQGDPDRGRQRYADGGCGGCHGEAGVAERREWPVLAGQRPLYLYKMLLDFKAGRVGGGEAATMAAMASTLDAADMADIAAWLGGLPRPAPAHESTAPPALLRGDRTRLIPPCEACHGADGQGWEALPAITGQNRAYFVAALTRFKEGGRANDINHGMGVVARELTAAEIQALAGYFSR